MAAIGAQILRVGAQWLAARIPTPESQISVSSRSAKHSILTDYLVLAIK
jgi:hypothetical protein